MIRIYLILFVLICYGCGNAPSELHNTGEILYVSHSRICDGKKTNKVDHRLLEIDYSAFDLVIHGGDVLCQTSKDEQKFGFADSVFGFTKDKTLWVKGNHDDDDTDFLRKKLKHEQPWNVKKIGNTHFLVLDYFMKDNVFSSDEYIEVLDNLALNQGDNLVVLTHYLYWIYNHEELKGLDESVSNVKICRDQEWCLKPNDFMELIYPELVGFENDGIKVVCLAGDVGVKRKTFQYMDSRGITFLANGLNDDPVQDSVLVFTDYDKDLKWSFKSFEDLE